WLMAVVVFLLPMVVSVLPAILNMGYYFSFILFMVGVIPVAMILTILSIFVVSKVQKITPNENLGKVMAIVIAVAQCAAPIGQVLYGYMFEFFRLSTYVPILIVNFALLLISVFAWGILRNENEGNQVNEK
ncbi:MAG: hypothetical protein ACRCUS_07210, partial [Anaerovoracaceae bacterium]